MCKKNGNHLLDDCVKLETDQQRQHRTCKDVGEVKAPKDFNEIRSHFVFVVKHDGRRKDRVVSDRHLSDFPISSVYSGMVCLRGIRLVLFLAELNVLESRGETQETLT